VRFRQGITLKNQRYTPLPCILRSTQLQMHWLMAGSQLSCVRRTSSWAYTPFLPGDGRRIGVGCILVLLSGTIYMIAYSWHEMLSGFWRWRNSFAYIYIFRIATDLNLHHVSTTKPTSENQEREILNKTRVWMICFNLDRSTATQFGKPSTIKENLYVSLSASCI